MPKKYLIQIFILALAFRIVVVLVFNTDNIYQDSREYYQIAANLVNGNGYTFDWEAPYKTNLYREPGYPLFLASLLKLWQFAGNEVTMLNEEQFYAHLADPSIYDITEITYLKIAQAVLDAISVVFFVLLASLIVKSKRTLLFYGFAFAIFLPAAYFITTLMRETWLMFLAAGFAYFFARFLFNRKMSDLIISSLLFGFMAVTFQVMLLLGPAIAIYLFVFMKPVSAVKYSIIAAAFTIVISLPWLMFSYSIYPDWKIVKSWGTSLTHEKMSYVNAHRKLAAVGLISEDSVKAIYWNEFGNTSYEAFNKSFNGFYNEHTKAINMQLDEFQNDETEKLTRSYRNKRLLNYAIVWVRPFSLKGIINNEFYNQETKLKNVTDILIAMAFLMGMLAFVGFIFHIRKLSPVLIVFYTLFILIWILGSGRRVQPIYGYLLLFFVLQAAQIFSFFKVKLKLQKV
ncbi:MAG: hypothetical protein RBR35_01285 [Salinivirgaceae bacterium]|jgi:hypothetical protein|nr:hypothetical protein [Salinivirgaceae bacterium]